MPHIFNPDLESGRIASRQSPGGPPCCNDRKGEQRKSAAAPQFRRVSDPAIRNKPGVSLRLVCIYLQTISPRTSPRGTPGSDGRCAKSKSSSDTRPGKLPYWYSYRSPVRPSWPPSLGAAGTLDTSLRQFRERRHTGGDEKHRRAVLTGRSAGTATDAAAASIATSASASGWECCWHPARHSYGPR